MERVEIVYGCRDGDCVFEFESFREAVEHVGQCSGELVVSVNGADWKVLV